MNNFYKRIILAYALAVIMLFICVLRVTAIAIEPKYAKAAQSESLRTVTLNFSRGTIFDCNMTRITNQKNVIYAVIFGLPTAIAELSNHFSAAKTEEILAEIRAKGFAVRVVDKKITANGIYCFSGFSHADDSLIAKHTIGYLDSSGKGACGLEAAFDSLLSGGENTITFSLNGQGGMLVGEQPQVNYNYLKEFSGVKITLNTKIQQIAEQAAMSINTGALIITEVGTGKIRAMVSRPDFKLSNLQAALENTEKPLLNRTLYTYNIGSVFKPFVAAAGYERGLAYTTTCVGNTLVDGLRFTCHKVSGHGSVDITNALKFSCNCFFYEYIQKLGAQDVLTIAQKAGFNGSVYLAQGLSAKAGSLGNTETLKNSNRALANFTIGQGELLLSPLAITNFYMAVANGGEYRAPSLVEGIVENGKLTKTESLSAAIRVLSENTANALKNNLSKVLLEGGTGQAAAPTLTTAAGKTGTAQTGIVKNGKKVTNSWFCGFFPLEEPRYAVTILWENSAGGVSSVFAEIADNITKYEQNNNY